MLFNNYTKLAPALVAIIYLISEEFSSNSNLVDKAPNLSLNLGVKLEGELIENSLLDVLALQARVFIENAPDKLITTIRAAYD